MHYFDHKNCEPSDLPQFMDIARMLNVTILACLLILTGCFGLFDDGDVIDDAEGDDTDSGSTTVVNTHPATQVMLGMYVGIEAEPIPSTIAGLPGYSGYYTPVYYAMLDVDGTITSAGFDIDLDGTIDVPVSESRGVVNLTIPISEWEEYLEDDEPTGTMFSTVAFIAIDDDSAHTVEMYTAVAEAFEESELEEDDGPSMYVLNAQDHTDDIESDAGMMTLTFGNGADMNWALLQIEIIKDSVPTTCDNPTNSGGNCGMTQHGGEEEQQWEKGETIIITSTGGNFCAEDCTLTVRVKYNGDVVMSAQLSVV